LILDGTFTFNDYKNIAPIGIDVNQTCNIGDSCLISGWGATRVRPNDFLQQNIVAKFCHNKYYRKKAKLSPIIYYLQK